MREASFLSKNEKKWRKVESILDKNNELSTEESVDLFIELTDDLSYARTHYSESVSTRYLNALTGGIHQKISKGKKEKLERIVRFWKYEVPLTIAKHHKQLLYSFLVFMLAVLIGAVSTHYDETFPRVILGDEYVDMTIENIEKGEPMAVYGHSESNSMFLNITFNNIRVSFLTFMCGILFSLGSYYFLFYNGIMLGAFQYFFFQKGVLVQSLLSIWIHGTIEISSIIVAGAAGIVLGNGLLFPGTLPRKASLVKSGKAGVKIIIGLVPLFVIAGFLESFITRLTDSPLFFKLLIIGGSLVFIIWYFIIYPIQLRKKSIK